MKELAFVIIVILVGFVLLGACLQGAVFDGQRQQLEREILQKQADIDAKALQEKRDIENQALQEQYARDLELKTLAATVLLIVGSVAILTPAFALAYYLVCRGIALRQ